ncbi:MAG: hypothetical protein ACK5A0_15365 [Polaromonas sp.]|jgi:hypothetical protein
MPRYASDYITGKRNLPQPYDGVTVEVPFRVVLPAALLLNDMIAICEIPQGIQIADFKIVAPQLDSNGVPTLAHSIGVENAARTDLVTVFEAGLTFGRTASGSISRGSVAVPALDTTSQTASRIIALKTTAIAATAALAGKTITVILYLYS